ncbi:thioesterase family protein [Novosphingobium pentaromativorans]|uniref:TesB-like acyl-CoA thioesterase 5 n=1 Tax=Novosphingobium pentaromativorans US6-1 TaxID=1088721 RepID=G6EDA1_9SPHN|nr:thioesterase family protein [Novosphingobium pentaromativorans]AIT79812.1 hypothetical protein JI59_08485 [Novosphingobium pentaromativorans US6-1]EHJ60700.1 hypothetical protein NSU_2322 [Novosphingobium pentaromativorans US6-1]
MTQSTVQPFYHRQGDRFVPTGRGVSPWDPNSQTGIALAGLAAHVLEGVPSLGPMHPARTTIDILGAVPMAPIDVSSRVIREGKRLQLAEIELVVDGVPRVRATAMRTRIEESPRLEHPLTRPFPTDIEKHTSPLGLWAEVCWCGDAPTKPGPGARWIRLNAQVAPEIPLSPYAMACIIADYGTATGRLLPREEWTMANTEITLHLTRFPRGDWLLIDSASESSGNGIGIVQSRLGDRDGMFGIAQQTLFLQRRKQD